MYFSSQNHFIFVHSNSTRLWFVFCHIDSRDRCLELVYWWKRNLFIVTCCLFQVTTSIKNLLFLIFRKKIANNSFYYYFFSLNTLSLPITLRSTWWRKKNNTKNPVCNSANKCKCYFLLSLHYSNGLHRKLYVNLACTVFCVVFQTYTFSTQLNIILFCYISYGFFSICNILHSAYMFHIYFFISFY